MNYTVVPILIPHKLGHSDINIPYMDGLEDVGKRGEDAPNNSTRTPGLTGVLLDLEGARPGFVVLNQFPF